MIVCIAAFLPLSQESLGNLFWFTLVTPNCPGKISLERLQGARKAGIGAGDPAAPTAPNLGEGRAYQGILGDGAGWTAILLHPHLWGKENAIWK